MIPAQGMPQELVRFTLEQESRRWAVNRLLTTQNLEELNYAPVNPSSTVHYDKKKAESSRKHQYSIALHLRRIVLCIYNTVTVTMLPISNQWRIAHSSRRFHNRVKPPSSPSNLTRNQEMRKERKEGGTVFTTHSMVNIGLEQFFARVHVSYGHRLST